MKANETILCACGCGQTRPRYNNDGQEGQFVHGHNEKTHGLSRSPTYHSWLGMKQRCLNPKDKRFADYGGRGIKVCERWMKFENFLADMGERPSGTSLERKNNHGNYEPGNCCWATPSEQQNNTRNNVKISHLGIELSVSQWARKLGLGRTTLMARISRGWPISEALCSTVYTPWRDHLSQKSLEVTKKQAT